MLGSMSILSRGASRVIMAIAAVTVFAACGGGGDDAVQDGETGVTGEAATSAPPPTPTPTQDAVEVGGGEPVELKLIVRVGFLRQRFEVPPGAEISLTFVNDDPVPHNFSLYVDEQMDESIFVGDRILSGTTTYEFGAPVEPGVYYFVCDIHPIMNGDFIVA
jgi:hypothetical protein